ncbi:MAG TPA: sodium:solute symporter family protein [Planctomycetota bacterium]
MAAAPYLILAFLLAMTLLGVWHARKIETSEDFALAGRRLGPGVLSGTLIATWIGTGSIFGNAQKTWEAGAVGFLLPISGVIGMCMLAWIAPRVRSLPAGSMPQLLGLRFGKVARWVGAIALLTAYLIIVSYQYRAGAAVAERLFPGLDLTIGSPGPDGQAATSLWPAAFAVFVILYTALAGMVSVAMTDVVNGIILSAGLLFGLAFAWAQWDPAVNPIPAGYGKVFGSVPFPKYVNWLLPTFLLILGDANLMQRFMAAKSPSTAKRAALVTLVGLLVLETAIIGLAFLGKLLLAPEQVSNPGHVIVAMAISETGDASILPPAIGLLILATVVAIIISTADSFLLACSTTAASDFHGGKTTPKRQRILVIVLGLIALGLAYSSDRFFEVALLAYTIYGATITPAVACALLRPKTSAVAVVSGMCTGLVVTVGWWLLVDAEILNSAEGLGRWDSVLPALLANVLVLVVVEKLSGKRTATPTPASER